MQLLALQNSAPMRKMPGTTVKAQTDPADTTFNYNSQDSTVFDNGTITLSGVRGGSAPSTDKVKLNTDLAPSAPNQYVFAEGDPREVAAQAFATVAHTVDVFGQAIGMPINWAFHTQQLGVNYDAGEDFNAYYARAKKSVNFFHNTDPKTNQVIFSGDSGEVVSHETGHAILDAFRPAYLSSFSPEPAAFHESFGDMMGICMSLQDPRVLQNVAQATGGDLSKDNIVAATGEQLGTAINDDKGKNVTGGNYVRNALNDFTWQDPNTLPEKGDATHLGSEAHSFSRLWTGAFYDVLKAIQKENLAATPDDPVGALKKTGDEALKLLAEMIKGAPQGDFTYRDMAKAWVAADQQLDGGKRADLITQVMTQRGILGDAPQGTSGGLDGIDLGSDTPTLHDMSMTLTGQGMRPLTSLTHPVTVTLGHSVPPMFQGAKVTTLVDNDGALAKDADAANRTRQAVANLIKQGRILITSPGQRLSDKDYFDKNGEPYVGKLVVNNDGTRTIERILIAG